MIKRVSTSGGIFTLSLPLPDVCNPVNKIGLVCSLADDHFNDRFATISPLPDFRYDLGFEFLPYFLGNLQECGIGNGETDHTAIWSHAKVKFAAPVVQ
jgi:hypothetical protein